VSRYKKVPGPIAYPLVRSDDEHDWRLELDRWAARKDWRIEEVIAGPQEVSTGWVQVAVRMAKRGAAA
jgi:DNA-binding transcriptional LysR family regulator